jgi:hypothetical protein
MPRPSYPPWFVLPSNACWGARIMKPDFTQFFSRLLLIPTFYVQISSSVPCSRKPSAHTLTLFWDTKFYTDLNWQENCNFIYFNLYVYISNEKVNVSEQNYIVNFYASEILILKSTYKKHCWLWNVVCERIKKCQVSCFLIILVHNLIFEFLLISHISM